VNKFSGTQGRSAQYQPKGLHCMAGQIVNSSGFESRLQYLEPQPSRAADADKNTLDRPSPMCARQEALSLLQKLNADLLSQPSATLTLDRWCEAFGFPGPVRIVANIMRDVQKAPTAEQRRLLGAGARDICYRRVQLRCDSYILSEADNWYLPERLTSKMNKELQETDIPFGRAVQALRFQRRTLSSEFLWQLSTQRDSQKTTPPSEILEIPRHVLEHQAILTLPDGTPFSLVVETYTGTMIAFAARGRPWSTHGWIDRTWRS
jgi:chorismate-pyruvate lyase